MQRSLRARIALALSIATTLAMALLLLILAVPYKLVFDWWAGRAGLPNPLRYYPWLHGFTLKTFYQLIAKTKPFQVESPKPTIHEEELVLVIANHFSNMSYPLWVCAFTQAISRHWVWVARHDMSPILRLPLWFSDLVLLINRENRDQAMQALEGQVETFTRRSNVFVIYPDGQRPNEERVLEDKQRFEQQLNRQLPWLTETKMFRAGGTQQLYKAMRATDRPVRVFVMESGLHFLDNGYTDIDKMDGSRFFARVRELPFREIPHPNDDVGWKRFMLDQCERTNLYLSKRRYGDEGMRHRTPSVAPNAN